MSLCNSRPPLNTVVNDTAERKGCAKQRRYRYLSGGISKKKPETMADHVFVVQAFSDHDIFAISYRCVVVDALHLFFRLSVAVILANHLPQDASVLNARAKPVRMQ